MKNAMRMLLLGVVLGIAAPASSGEGWTKLADLPADLAEREMPPGMEGTWCWVPELNGFLLYGGYSPRLTNEGWVYDPAKNEMRLLWSDDSLRYDEAARQWRAIMPRDIIWSQDRPGPARNRAAVYSPDTKKVYFFGGHPGAGREWFGDTKLGTWEFDPTTLKFRHLGDGGPTGQTQGVYDSANRLIVATPSRRGEGDKAPVITWVLSPAAGKWEDRAVPGGPAPGPNAAFAYDPNAKLCVYFSEYGQTWAYDAVKSEWKERKPAAAPPVRRHSGLCYDPGRKLLVLHGGVHHIIDGGKVWAGYGAGGCAFNANHGQWFSDTWTYDAAKNEWKELPAGGAPPAVASSRTAFANDPAGGGLVLYDAAIGIWALGGSYPQAAGEKPPAAVVSPEVLTAQKVLASHRPAEDPKAREWREKLRNMPDDSWLAAGSKPYQGCLNFMYNPDARCLMWLGGCGGAVNSTWDDYGYNNQIVLCDFDVGKWFQRRPNHQWGPARAAYANCRHANGCGRGFCYDSKRKVVWTLGGVASTHYPGTHSIQTYDVAADRYSVTGPHADVWASNCGLVYDPTNDLVVLVENDKGTSVFDPNAKQWRRGAPHPEKKSQYTNAVCDPQVGVILIVPTESGTEAHAYDAKTDKWRDLAPAGAEGIKCGSHFGVTYDSRNRGVIVAEQHPDDAGYGKPRLARRVWVLDLAANAWKEGQTSPLREALNMGSAAYDANHNVAIFGGPSSIMLYRWKGGCPADAFGSPAK